ncbi:MAG TPA: hypothetical protein VKQ09_03825 [Sphingomonas sp.]|jgi:hypothetical protein|nr:hypothetical protein [Sphingomonas sp.]
MRSVAIALPVLLSLATPALASSPAAWAAHNVAVRNACAKASGLSGAAASAPVRFDDRSGQDVVLVTGRYTQRGLKGRPATMLCLYDRRSKRAAVEDAAAWSKPSR